MTFSHQSPRRTLAAARLTKHQWRSSCFPHHHQNGRTPCICHVKSSSLSLMMDMSLCYNTLTVALSFLTQSLCDSFLCLEPSLALYIFSLWLARHQALPPIPSKASGLLHQACSSESQTATAPVGSMVHFPTDVVWLVLPDHGFKAFSGTVPFTGANGPIMAHNNLSTSVPGDIPFFEHVPLALSLSAVSWPAFSLVEATYAQITRHNGQITLLLLTILLLSASNLLAAHFELRLSI